MSAHFPCAQRCANFNPLFPNTPKSANNLFFCFSQRCNGGHWLFLQYWQYLRCLALHPLSWSVSGGAAWCEKYMSVQVYKYMSIHTSIQVYVYKTWCERRCGKPEHSLDPPWSATDGTQPSPINLNYCPATHNQNQQLKPTNKKRLIGIQPSTLIGVNEKAIYYEHGREN